MNETIPGVYRLDEPGRVRIPLVLDSPHSGSDYPESFDTTVPLTALRRAEDMYVDDLFADGPELGASLVSALYPRSFIDPHRDVRDLDRDLLTEPWPDPVAPTEKARLGHGLIWRVCPPDYPMYPRRLSIEEVQDRIAHYWEPYHNVLQRCMDETYDMFGMAWHINCHSMPSSSLPRDNESNYMRRADFVLGDRDGTTCSREFLNVVETLKNFGYLVRINDPHEGVEIVRRHGVRTSAAIVCKLRLTARFYERRNVRATPYYTTLKSYGEIGRSCRRLRTGADR